jgi:hypothetical protein
MFIIIIGGKRNEIRSVSDKAAKHYFKK